jgi:biopolymer transport protein ExbB/TolQ
MRKVWPWIIGIVVGLVIVALLVWGGSNRQAYRIARGAINARVEASQDRIDTAVQMATAAVDQALVLAGNLPSQQAKADLVKQDIEEIGNRLKDAAEAQGEAAIEQLNASIDQFNQALDTVNQAEEEATLPAAKAALYRISLILEGAKERIVQLVKTAGQ